MKAYHPDDTDMRPAGWKDDKGGKKNQGPNDLVRPFFPGQLKGIASQLNRGFGGGRQTWRQSIGANYAPFRNAIGFPYGNLTRGGKGGNKNGDNNAPPDPDPGYPDGFVYPDRGYYVVPDDQNSPDMNGFRTQLLRRV